MSQSPATRFPAATLALAMAILGTVGAFATEAGLDPVTMVFWRCVFATAFLTAWCLARGCLPDRGLTLGRLALAGLGGVCMVLSWTAFFAGFALTSIATTTIVYHIQPFFVVLIGAALFKERLTLDPLLWMSGAFAGVALASGFATGIRHPGQAWVLGVLLTLGAALLYAIAVLLAKGLGRQRPEVTALCQTAVGILLLGPFANFSSHVPAASWGWLVGIGILHTGVAYVLMYSAYPRLTTPVIGVLTFIYPAVAILIDWTVYRHPLTWDQGAGMVLIAFGTLGVRLGWRFPRILAYSACDPKKADISGSTLLRSRQKESITRLN